MLEAAYAAVVHEHEAFVREGVAVGVGEVAFCRGSHVGEDQRGCRLGCYPGEVDAVPGWDGGCEYAWFWAKRWGRVVADAKAISIVWTAAVLLRERCENGEDDKGTATENTPGGDASQMTASEWNVKGLG